MKMTVGLACAILAVWIAVMVSLPVRIPPYVMFDSDSDSGFYFLDHSDIGFTTGGKKIVTFHSDGTISYSGTADEAVRTFLEILRREDAEVTDELP